MAREVAPLQSEHIAVLANADHHAGVDFRSEAVRHLIGRSLGFVGLEDGEPVAAAGIAPMWEGVGHAWAVISVPTGGGRLLWITRQVRAWLNVTTEWRRIQTTVTADFDCGLAWASALGFKPEGRLLKYDAQGRDHIMFARTY